MRVAVLIAGLYFCSCFQSVDPAAGKGPYQSRCDQCHPYPAAKCEWAINRPVAASPTIAGPNTCFGCHGVSIWHRAIAIPSLVQSLYWAGLPATGKTDTIYGDDSLFTLNGVTFSATDTGHLNGRIDMAPNPVQFARCNTCHPFPPTSGHHQLHVQTYHRLCLECHFATIVFDSSGSLLDQGAPVYGQKVFITAQGDTVPFVKNTAHMNSSLDVVFRIRAQALAAGDTAYNSLFVWNNADKSCSNIECHSRTADYQRTIW